MMELNGRISHIIPSYVDFPLIFEGQGDTLYTEKLIQRPVGKMNIHADTERGVYEQHWKDHFGVPEKSQYHANGTD